MKNIKGIVYHTLNSLLSGSVIVDDAAVKYYVGYFGTSDSGIYIESYRSDDVSSKHFFAEEVTIDIVTFSKSITTTTSITREVIGILKASVRSTLQLCDETWQATYTQIPIVTSITDQREGIPVHRDTIRLQMRIDKRNY